MQHPIILVVSSSLTFTFMFGENYDVGIVLPCNEIIGQITVCYYFTKPCLYMLCVNFFSGRRNQLSQAGTRIRLKHVEFSSATSSRTDRLHRHHPRLGSGPTETAC